MDDNSLLKAFFQSFGKELAKQLYGDIRALLPNLLVMGKKLIRTATAPIYPSPEAVIEAAKRNLVQDGDLITIQCKPAQFGPFLRNHFLSPIYGNRTNMRLGPPLVSNSPVLATVAQITSQLTPVGLFPPLKKMSARFACTPQTLLCVAS